MSPIETAHAPSEWISGAEVTRRHPEISRVRLYRLAAAQLVRTQLIPGSAPRYSAADLDRLMSASADERR
jgi:hypothetical protein